MKLNETKVTRHSSNSTPDIWPTIIAVVLFILIGWFLFHVFTYKSDEPELPPLDLTVQRGVDGITLVNNEGGTLTSCTVMLNSKYKTDVKYIDSEDRTYAYGGFLSNDNERFNIFNYQVKSVFISACNEDKNRSGYYEW